MTEATVKSTHMFHYSAPTDAVIYVWLEDEKLEHNGIALSRQLSKDVRWARCMYAGPTSVVKPTHHILLSARPASYAFEINGVTMYNTSDKSCLAYRHHDKVQGFGPIKATGKTILYTWVEEPEEVTESGIVLVRKDSTKEMEPRWANVVAAGPETGVKEGQQVLLAFKSDNYKLDIDGQLLMNAGCEEIIAIRSWDIKPISKEKLKAPAVAKYKGIAPTEYNWGDNVIGGDGAVYTLENNLLEGPTWTSWTVNAQGSRVKRFSKVVPGVEDTQVTLELAPTA